jgi:SAM-dependent methyltransferase
MVSASNALASLVANEEEDMTLMWLRELPLCLSLLVVLATATASILHRRHGQGRGNNETRSNTVRAAMVPFLVMEEPSWRDLHVMLEKYRQDSSNLLRALSQSLEVALHSEREMGIEPEIDVEDSNNIHPQRSMLFSKRLENRLGRVSACLYHNEKELNRLMQNFTVRFALPFEQYRYTSDNELGPKTTQHYSSTNHTFTMPNSFARAADPSQKNVYDCGAQVIAHIVRDWTVLGKPVRASIYDWCREMVEKYVSISSSSLPILVPGAGLGRLAHDLAFLSKGYSVEANEVSLSMAAAAHSILQTKGNGTVYPFAIDSFANEVESGRHYDQVPYPDVKFPLEDTTSHHGSVSYTIGDFVKIYRWQRPKATFGCVVTCFFLDTATNVYEYLSTIEHALAPGGLWINIGPLRWHHNSALHPAADELRSMIESSIFLFEVIQWSVDEEPSEYRHEDREVDSRGKRFVRSTAYDGYRPLRFVVRRR